MNQPYDIATRAQIATLRSVGLTIEAIQQHIGISVERSTCRRIYEKACSRGWIPKQTPLLNVHLEDAPRSGRPTKQTAEKVAEIEAKVTKDRYGREKTSQMIADEVSLSASTVQRVLRSQGYHKTKPTRKPGLTEEQKRRRLDLCLWLKEQPEEWWHRLIWTDETSVILGQRRGGYRIWRKADEMVNRSCIRRRWKSFSVFMFWGSFSYFHKGPYHIYETETAAKRRASDKVIGQLNDELEPIKKAEWEAGLKRTRGPKPVWKWDERHGKLQRSKRGGIDWFRYWSEVLIPKLFPFTRRINGVVVEDGAPCHSHHFVQREYKLLCIEKMEWCGNSPDLNAIEPTWLQGKRETTKKSALNIKKEAEKSWKQFWEDFPQERFQGYVDRIRWHVDKVIECKGGNEYIEGLRTREKARKARKAAVIERSDGSDVWFDCAE